MFAPILRRGAITRSIGRLERLAPPTRRLSKLWPASNPASKRMVVAEFPQSISPDGRGEKPFLSVHDEHIRLRMLDLDPENAEGLHCPHAIFARKETAQNANTIRKRGDNRGAVRDALVARHRHFRLDAGRPFNAKFHTTLLVGSASPGRFHWGGRTRDGQHRDNWRSLSSIRLSPSASSFSCL